MLNHSSERDPQMERAVQISQENVGGPIATMGRGTRVEREERVFRALAQLRWAEGPIAIVASDLADLEDKGSVEAIGSLIDLSLTLRRNRIMVLNLEYLALEGSSVPLVQRINALQWVIRRIAREMKLSMPRFVLEERGKSLDLRVDLTTH